MSELKGEKQQWPWCAIVLTILLAVAIATFGEKILTDAGLRNGINLFIALSIFFLVSNIASIVYRKWKKDFLLILAISADMFTVATLGLNIAEDYVKSYPCESWFLTFIVCFIMLVAKFFLLEPTSDKKNIKTTETDPTPTSEKNSVLSTENGKQDSVE